MSRRAIEGDPEAREDATRFAAATRRFLERRGRRVPAAVREAALDAAAALERAAAAGDGAGVEAASGRLDDLWRDHLSRAARKTWLRELAESTLWAVLIALAVRAFVVEAFRIPSASMAPTLSVGDHIVVLKLAYGLPQPLGGWLLRWREPRRGDVVVFESPRQPGREYVKRVVGVPGDVVELRDQILYVNGVPQRRTPLGETSYEEQAGASGAWLGDACPAFLEELALGPLAPPGGGAGDVAAAFATGSREGTRAHAVLQCRRAPFGEREGPFERVGPGHVFVLGDNRDRSADSRSDGGWQVPIERIVGEATHVWWSWGGSGWWPGRPSGGLRTERLFKAIE